MKTNPLIFLLLASGFLAYSQTATSPPNPCAAKDACLAPADTQFMLGTGSGFKPYQSSIKDSSSAFVEGGYHASSKIWTFARVEFYSTYAQMVAEGCLSMFSSQGHNLMLCGGPGFGADATNAGLALAGGGKWFFSPAALNRHNVWVGLEMGVVKTTVPAPSSSTTTPPTNVSPVQPDIRVGIHYSFGQRQ